MGQPAARLGDPMAHGGAVVVGCPTVLVGGMPAARVGDMHVCPMLTGLVPHVGGPLALGSFTVLAGGAPQARASDMAVCVGPPDTVAMGAPTVMVGDAGGGSGGVVAAVLGAMVSGVHTLLGDTPRAVMLPDGTWETRYARGLVVQGSPEFQAQTVRILDTVRSTHTGRALVKALSDSGRTVTVRTDRGRGSLARAVDPAGAVPSPDGMPGVGSDVTVHYDPEGARRTPPPGSPHAHAPWQQASEGQPDVALVHALVLALAMARGDLDMTLSPNAAPLGLTVVPRAARRAVGLPPDDQGLSENAYRVERGLPPRTLV